MIVYPNLGNSLEYFRNVSFAYTWADYKAQDNAATGADFSVEETTVHGYWECRHYQLSFDTTGIYNVNTASLKLKVMSNNSGNNTGLRVHRSQHDSATGLNWELAADLAGDVNTTFLYEHTDAYVLDTWITIPIPREHINYSGYTEFWFAGHYFATDAPALTTECRVQFYDEGDGANSPYLDLAIADASLGNNF